ncbi:MAG: radical SAM protein [Elusimicrobiota bacterium]
MTSLQLHLTNKCNLRCLHCYGNFSSLNNSFIDIKLVKKTIEDYLILCEVLGCKSAVAFTGGEPLLHPNFLSILDYSAKKLEEIFIFTNASFITEDLIYKFSQYDNLFVKISIEGSREANDRIRGISSFERTCEAIDELNTKEIPVYCSMTVNHLNIQDVLCFLDFCLERVVVPVIQRYIPLGRGAERLKLSKDESLKLYKLIKENRRKYSIYPHCTMCSIISIEDDNYLPNGCNIGTDCIVVDEKGDYITCPYINVKIGDVRESRIYELFFTSSILNKFRLRKFGKFCSSCKYNRFCGGCRAISLAYTGAIYGDEPLCPLILE